MWVVLDFKFDLTLMMMALLRVLHQEKWFVLLNFSQLRWTYHIINDHKLPDAVFTICTCSCHFLEQTRWFNYWLLKESLKSSHSVWHSTSCLSHPLFQVLELYSNICQLSFSICVQRREFPPISFLHQSLDSLAQFHVADLLDSSTPEFFV